MLISTCDIPADKKATQLGLVRGNIVVSKNIGRDLMASVRNVVGGEVVSYTQMTNEARDEAEQRMEQAAQQLGADAIYCTRFCQDTIVDGTIEIICYGTAVKFDA